MNRTYLLRSAMFTYTQNIGDRRFNLMTVCFTTRKRKYVELTLHIFASSNCSALLVYSLVSVDYKPNASLCAI